MFNQDITAIVNQVVIEAENRVIERRAELEAVDSLLGVQDGPSMPISEALEMLTQISPVYIDGANDLKGLREYLRVAADRAWEEAFWLRDFADNSGSIDVEDMLDGAQEEVDDVLTELRKVSNEYNHADPDSSEALSLQNQIEVSRQRLLEGKILTAFLNGA